MTRQQLKTLTLAALRAGICVSKEMRDWISREGSIDFSATQAINAHAWALVELQQEGEIEKVRPGCGSAWNVDPLSGGIGFQI